MSAQSDQQTKSAARRVTLEIFGLLCEGGGALTIERELTRQPGVTRAYVNPATEMAYVEYDPARASVDHLISAVRRYGFDAALPRGR
jgi:Cu+-exporting ATPase